MSKFEEKMISSGGGGGAGPQGPPGASGTDGPGPSCNHINPGFQWKDSDTITVEAGRFYALGHRIRGRFQDAAGASTYWDFSSDLDVDVTDVYSAGSQPGFHGHLALSESSLWCGVFVVGVNDVIILPFCRVDTIDYDSSHSGKTTITPGDYVNDANDNVINSDDLYNNYRVVRLPTFSAPVPRVFTIEDTVNGSPDQIVIDGDQTSYTSVGEWFQIIPPAATPFVYIGSIFWGSTTGIVEFWRLGWTYQWATRRNTGLRNSTSVGNTEISSLLSPLAIEIDCYIAVYGANVSATYGVGCGLGLGNSGGANFANYSSFNGAAITSGFHHLKKASDLYPTSCQPLVWHPTDPGIVRNNCIRNDTASNPQNAPASFLNVSNYTE